MTKADITAALVADFGFSQLSPVIRRSNEHWFARSIDDDIAHYLCVEYKSNKRVFEVSFGVESKSIRAAALAVIDQISVDTGVPLISSSIWTKAPCLTMFPLIEPTRDIPATIARSDFTTKFMSPLDVAVLRKVDTLAAVCSTLLRTDGAFEWGRSASGFRVVYAAVLVDRLGLDSAVFWRSVATLPDSFLSGHVAVKQTGLKGPAFLARVAEALSLGTMSASRPLAKGSDV